MKKIILTLILIYYIYCTMDSCINEKDHSNCSNHTIELKDFSCYKLNYFKIVDFGKMCIPFPDNYETQKTYLNLAIGNAKELYASTLIKYELMLYVSKKETYTKGEEIFVYPMNGTIFEKDFEILEKKNTCGYQYFGRYFDEKKEGDESYKNITDKNICFNVDQFDELKNLLNCGYAEIEYAIGDKKYGIKTCFFIPDEKMTDDIKIIFKKYIDISLKKGYFPLLYDSIEEIEIRKLEENNEINYHIIVEDKNGKKDFYSSNLDDNFVIDNETDTDKDYSYDNEIYSSTLDDKTNTVKNDSDGNDSDNINDFQIFKSNSFYLTLNIILLLFFINFLF